MSCFSSNKIPPLKQDLSKTNFDEILLHIRGSTLKFDNINGVFVQIASSNPNPKLINETERVSEEEEKLKEEIQMKTEKIKYIKNKLADIDKKQEMMMKILNVDLNEKEYVNELKAKCGHLFKKK